MPVAPFPQSQWANKASGKTFTAKIVPWLCCMFRAVLLPYLHGGDHLLHPDPQLASDGSWLGYKEILPSGSFLDVGMIQPHSLLSAPDFLGTI